MTAGEQIKKTDKELLGLMKQLAVRFQNQMVHVQDFLHQVQSQEKEYEAYRLDSNVQLHAVSSVRSG